MILGHVDRDDVELFHGGVYDPQKAHEYYLKRRQLKGRKKGSQDQPSGRGPSRGSSSSQGMRPSRREELLREREILEKRLDRLRDVLKAKVEAAKKRSGVKTPEEKHPRESAQTKGGGSKKGEGKPLTAAQKRKKRIAAKKQYEKEKKLSLSQEVEHLHRQIKDIRAKIEKAVADAQKNEKHHSNPQTAPKGR